MIKKLDTTCHYPLTKGEYFIYDDNENNKPLFLDEDAIWNLKIVNNSDINIDFFQNDNCLMTDNNLKKCDWIIIFENEFYFVEAKNVKPSRRKQERKDAVEKFKATIPYFLNIYPEVKKMNLFVIMNFKSLRTITNAANKARKSYFNETFDAEYIETNILKFN